MNFYPRLDEASVALRRAIVDEVARNDFVSFTRLAFETVVPGESLHLNWHVRAIAHALEQVRLGHIKRLIITVPPRHLKSLIGSVAFPAFVLGHKPNTKILCASYSAELAIKHANDFRAVMRSARYRRLFPHSQISPEKNTELELMTTSRGGRSSTSVGGTVTGRGGNIIILDDPMKPDDALSEVRRQSGIDWFRLTLLSRLNAKLDDAIVVIMQRIHDQDLVGVLLEEGGWHHLNLPAIADCDLVIPIGEGKTHRFAAGDVLDAVREPRHVLDRMKASMGSMAFSAQYLQRPIPAEGNLIKRAWLQFYEVAPQPTSNDQIVISVDTAMKADEIADYSVATVWLMKKEKYYLLDLIRGRFDYPALKKQVLRLKQRWLGATILIEDKGSGTSLIQELRYENLSVIGIKPEGDKTTRLYSTQAIFEAESVLFPRDAPWLQDMILELLAFPKYRHDDQVDSISQALIWMRRRARSAQDGDLGMPILVPKDPTWEW